MRRGTWMRVVYAPASAPPRPVQITYLWRVKGPGLPERERRHGIILMFVWPLFAAFSGFMGWVWITKPSLGPFVGVFCVVAGLYALGYLVNGLTLLRRGRSNLAGKHEFVGRVLDSLTFKSRNTDGDPVDVYFLAVDFGGDAVPGWQIDLPTFRSYPVGAAVKVAVSGDREFLYGIAPA
jgi:hypothetical protein